MHRTLLASAFAAFSLVAGAARAQLFANPQLPVGPAPRAIATGDFNGDGRPDLATASSLTSTVSRLLGGPNGFSAAASVAVPAPAVDLAAGDLNGDGLSDLLAGSSSAASVLLATGGGAFAAGASAPVPKDVYAVALADVNVDGTLDALAITASPFSFGSGGLAVYLGDGSGGLGPLHVYAVNNSPISLLVADLNGDSKLDIASIVAIAFGIEIAPGDGLGGFGVAAYLGIGFPTSLTAGDFLADGVVDLAVGTIGDVEIRPGLGGGAFGAPITTAIGTSAARLAANDVDGDAKLDLLAVSPSDSTVRLLRGDALGSFATPATFAVGGSPADALLADLDLDARVDAAVANAATSNVTWLRGNGAGIFNATPSVAAGSDPIALVTGDFNGDGVPDVVAAANASFELRVLVGTAAGALAAGAIVQVAPPSAIASGDLDGDGVLDLVATSSAAKSFSWLRGNGIGGFIPLQTIPLGIEAWSVAVADLDADSRADVALSVYGVSGGGDAVLVFRGQGGGALGPPGTYTTAAGGGGLGPAAIAVARMNGDAILDLVTADAGTNEISVLLGAGFATFLPPTVVAAGGQPFSLAVLDADGDGATDVAAAVPFQKALALLRGDGAGGLGAPSLLPVDGGPGFVAAADLDGDGRADLAAAAGDAAVLLNAGGGAFAAAQHFTAGGGSAALAPLDLDGDGRTDLAVAATATDDVSTLRNLAGLPIGVVAFGSGTPGCAGTMAIGASASPHVGGASFAFTCTNAPAGALGLLIVGSSASLAGSDPLALGALFHVDLFASAVLDGLSLASDASGSAVAPAPIPPIPSLAGVALAAQGIWIESAAASCGPSPFRLVSTRGLGLLIAP